MSYVLSQQQIMGLKWKRSFPRETKARIVPYYVNSEGEVYFLLGKEHYNHNPARGIYNMLGGCREKNETIFECADRELSEETIGVLNFQKLLIEKMTVIQRNRRYIIFIPLKDGSSEIIIKFNMRKKLLDEKKYEDLSEIMKYEISDRNVGYLSEIDELIWVHQSGICGRQIYRSVTDIFWKIVSEEGKNIGLSECIKKLNKLGEMS